MKILNPRFYQLLSKFFIKFKCYPILVNTSFNVKKENQLFVKTASKILHKMFYGYLELDVLVIDNFILYKQDKV